MMATNCLGADLSNVHCSALQSVYVLRQFCFGSVLQPTGFEEGQWLLNCTRPVLRSRFIELSG